MVLSVMSCDKNQADRPLLNNIPTDSRITYNVVVLDGCQYICGSSGGFTHKGNCKNPIHQYSH